MTAVDLDGDMLEHIMGRASVSVAVQKVMDIVEMLGQSVLVVTA